MLHYADKAFIRLGIIVNIILLTHTREVLRANNTGQLVSKVLGERARVVEWHRKQPDAALLSLIAAGKVGLVFPSDEIVTETHVSSASAEYLVLIDATWQEARKMFNQSPYLKTLPRVALQASQASIYPLRRNQIEGGLCTAECVALLLKNAGEPVLAKQLTDQLMAFIED